MCTRYEPASDDAGFNIFDKQEIESSIPARFAQIVRQYPNALAIKNDTDSLTYTQLDAASEAVARAILDRLGDESTGPVVIFAELSTAVIVAILGVLKSDKFYVVLDPTVLSSQLPEILDDVQSTLVVATQQHYQLALDLSQSRWDVINLDTVEPNNIGAPIQPSIQPDSPAAIYYTSGSTGSFKGVVLSHRMILYDAWHKSCKHQISQGDRHSLIFSPSFAISLINIFGTILNGAALCPYRTQDATLHETFDWLVQQRLTIFNPTVGLLRQLFDAPVRAEQLSTLRLLFIGGETIHQQDIKQLQKSLPTTCTITHRLASTETGCIAEYDIRDTSDLEDRLPAGLPPEGKDIFLWGEDNQAVEPGQIGEIIVYSRYLSPGYWRNPSLNAAKFLADPESGDKQLYRTGDMGRIRPDGMLEHLGRKDQMVKIRGFRIELAAIERALLEVPFVKTAVVMADDHQTKDQALVAYIVPKTESFSVSQLRSALSKTLPDYMIPLHFVTLDSLPLLPNGKIDRQALPDLGNRRPDLDTPFVAPRTPFERILCTIWSDILKIDGIGIHDSFLALGGHSLQAMRLVAQVQKEFNVTISVAELFTTASVAEMAMVILTHLTSNRSSKE